MRSPRPDSPANERNNRKLSPSIERTLSSSPIPDSRFPIPDSRFPIRFLKSLVRSLWSVAREDRRQVLARVCRLHQSCSRHDLVFPTSLWVAPIVFPTRAGVPHIPVGCRPRTIFSGPHLPRYPPQLLLPRLGISTLNSSSADKIESTNAAI